MPYEVFMGLRYLRARRKQTVISVVTGIAVFGVALGVFALITVIAVMSGFQKDLRDKILGSSSHVVVVASTGDPVDEGALRETILADRMWWRRRRSSTARSSSDIGTRPTGFWRRGSVTRRWTRAPSWSGT